MDVTRRWREVEEVETRSSALVIRRDGATTGVPVSPYLLSMLSSLEPVSNC